MRRPVKCVKRIKGKKGKPDTFDLIVQIDRVGSWLAGWLARLFIFKFCSVKVPAVY